MHDIPKIDALIVAAGKGTRAGGAIPKQFLPIGGVPMLRRVIDAYQSHPAIRNVHVVIGAGQEEFYKEKLPFALGGERRQDSVLSGLRAMTENPPDYVLIADAARPFTTHQIMDDVIAALAPETAVLTAVPLTDTLKFQADGHTQTIPRQNHWLAQTPQAFPFQKILSLHQSMQGQDFTDDVALFEAAGMPTVVVASTTGNMKITTSEDFEMAEALLASQNNNPQQRIENKLENRIGHGFDVHRFSAGDHVWLGGVRIPHTHGVEAHSDGDVVLHAVTDALLGTIGAGDIGQHFPPSDPKWRGASSDQFVQHAIALLRARGGAVINADVTVLCEAPRIGTHRTAMQSRLAELLGVEAERVNIKATTTEKLGALGRSEGLAAEAVVLAALPT